MATLLCGGFLPCLPASRLRTVHLQAGHLGLRTDDIACESVDEKGQTRRLIVQIKSTVKILESDAAVSAAWQDFQTMDADRRRLDALALFTGPFIGEAARQFRTVLAWSRSTVDAAGFLRKMARKNYIADDARKALATVRGICDAANRRPVADEALWEFLRRYHLLPFDFDTPDGSQDLARVKTMLALAARPASPAEGEELWNGVFQLVNQRNPRAGSFIVAPDLRDWEPLHGRERDLEQLFSRTGHHAPVFAAYCGLLYSIGAKCLFPQSIVLLSERLRAGQPHSLLADDTTRWNLENILNGIIYGAPSPIRFSPSRLQATLHILDEMIE